MVAYYLRFRSPIHLGERGVGQEEVRDYVPADTLFSALCIMQSLLYGTDALSQLLERYLTKGREPFFLTSAFPFAGDIRFYPKPLRPPDSAPDYAKRWKNIRWVSERVFQAYLNGETIPLDPPTAPAQGSLRLLLQDGRFLIHPEEWEALQTFWDYEADDLCVYQKTTVPRVTLDRITSSSQIWHFGEVYFAEGCGLWFGVQFGDPSFQDSLEACLRLLGDTGLGGERGSGRGLFHFDRREWQLNAPESPSRFVTLSPWLPATPEERQWLQQNGSAYELIRKYGWLGSPTANNLRRKEVWMVAEGAVIAAPPQFRVGQLVDLSPDLAPHPTYRYGYAFPIGVK